MPDLLDTTRREIDDRIKELKPLVEEYHQLETAANAIGGRASVAAPSNGRRRKRGRPRGSVTRTTKPTRPRAASGRKRRAGRPKGTGTRSTQALAAVQAQPGITIPELASRIGIKQNYLYRVMPGMEKEKKVRKQGRGWHPTP